MNIRVLEVIGGLVVFLILFLGVGGLWNRLFPKESYDSVQRPNPKKDNADRKHN